MPVEFDAPAQEHRPAVTWFLAAVIISASVHAFFHLQEAVQLSGINSGTSAPAARFDLRYLIFSPYRNHSSCWEHVFSSFFRR